MSEDYVTGNWNSADWHYACDEKPLYCHFCASQLIPNGRKVKRLYYDAFTRRERIQITYYLRCPKAFRFGFSRHDKYQRRDLAWDDILEQEKYDKRTE